MQTPAQKRALAKYRSSAWYKNRFKRMKRNPKKYAAFCARRREQQRLWNLRVKKTVLAHYGKRGKLRCVWAGCEVTDLDCLTLDHVENNGKEHRAAGYPGGVNGYRVLLAAGMPSGYQTLCANHQLKKENLRRRNG